ncbi:hypothetical protein CVT25_009595 [Psilocybe cyanescens]|uniref:Uncharacterized protein n=1 Tax=Psilocybe cyanescens TaxID=93625 RepID=A0A409XDP8_PSICY|nr:hypothetical protein CVT25_009595 [Psilocybe cyanescens]
MTLGVLFTSQDEWFYNYNRRRSLFLPFTVFTIWRYWSSWSKRWGWSDCGLKPSSPSTVVVGPSLDVEASPVGTTTTSDPFVFFMAFRRTCCVMSLLTNAKFQFDALSKNKNSNIIEMHYTKT